MDSCRRSLDPESVRSGDDHRRLEKRISDFDLGELDGDGGVDRGWRYTVHTQTIVTIVVTPGGPRVSRQSGDDDGNGFVVGEKSPSSWVGWRVGR